MTYLDEAQVEIAAIDYFRELGYEYAHCLRITFMGIHSMEDLEIVRDVLNLHTEVLKQAFFFVSHHQTTASQTSVGRDKIKGCRGDC